MSRAAERIQKNATTIAFVSAKGGSGKTVLCNSLGVILASLGKKVLLVDCDASTNGMTLLHLPRVLEGRKAHFGAVGLFETKHGEEAIAISVGDGVFLTPATYTMRQTEMVDPGFFGGTLEALVRAAKPEFDFILLDAQAGSDFHAQSAIRMSSKVVIVSEYDPISAEGVERLKRLFVSDMDNRDVWTLFNKVLPEFASLRSDFLETVRVLPPVPWDADVIRAFTRRQLAVDVTAGNPYTFALAAVLRALVPESEHDLDEWMGRIERTSREPIVARMQDLDRGISKVEEALASASHDLHELRSRSGVLTAGTVARGATFLAAATSIVALSVTSNSSKVAIAVSISLATVLLLWTAIDIVTTRGPTLRRGARIQEELALEARVLALQRDRSTLITDLDKYRQLADSSLEEISRDRLHRSRQERSESM